MSPPFLWNKYFSVSRIVAGNDPDKIESFRQCFVWYSHTVGRIDFQIVISCYDNPDAFHFVDPPYINTDCGHYEGCFNEKSMEDLL